MKKMIAIIAGSLALLLFPVAVSAHHISGTPVVSCDAGTLSVTVSSWTGNVEVVKQPSGPTSEKLPSGPNAMVVFSLATIGGNGTYKVGRQGNPTDPTPITVVVNCVVVTPSPSPTVVPPTPTPPTVTPTPSNTPRPVPTPTATPPVVTVPDTGAASGGPGAEMMLTFAVFMLLVGVAGVALFGRERD